MKSLSFHLSRSVLRLVAFSIVVSVFTCDGREFGVAEAMEKRVRIAVYEKLIDPD